MNRVTVPEAAELLGVTQSAIRKRIQRGTIPWDKDGEGRLYVYVDYTGTSPETEQHKSRNTSSGQSREDLLEVYREQVEFLYQELERKDTIIMSLARRMPELEAAPRLQEAPMTENGDKDQLTTEPPEQRRSWLYRFFFGP